MGDIKSKYILIIFFIIIICLPLILPFLKPGYFPTQDGEWAIVRLAEMHREVRDLQFPPRWSGYLNHGYGYPLFLFTYPLPFYIGEIFYISGFGLVGSIKLLFILSVVGSATMMFILAKELWGRWAAIIATIFYLYAPYRMVNLYVRGSVGESLALVFYPLLFWLLLKMAKLRSAASMIITGVAFSLFILTHNATVVLFLPFMAAWAGFLLWQNSRYLKELITLYFGAGVIGLSLSAFFWLPALVEKKYIVLSQVPLADKAMHFLSLNELVQTGWSFATRPPLQIGVIPIFVLVLTFIYLLIGKPKNPGQSLFFAGMSILAIIMLLPISNYIWSMPLLSDIDFPWRMLSVVIFLLAMLAGKLVIADRYTKVLMLGLGVVTIIIYSFFIQTRPREFKTDEYYATNDATTTSADELMPIWVGKKPTNRPENLVLINSSVVSDVNETSDEINFTTYLTRSEKVIVQKVYFPGWKAYIDEKETPVGIVFTTGLMKIDIDPGIHDVKFIFTRTPVRWMGDILTLIGGIGVISVWVLSKRYYRWR